MPSISQVMRRGAIHNLCLAALVATSTTAALADQPRHPVQVIDLMEAEQADPSLLGFELLINTDTIRHIQVTSVIFDSSEHPISTPDPLDIDIVLDSMRNLGTTGVVAGPGDTIPIADPHNLNLAPGLYAERIALQVFDEALDVDFADMHVRFLEVTEGGIYRLSSTEYTHLTEPTVLDVNPNGDVGIAAVGLLGSDIPDEELVVQPRPEQMAVMLESGDPEIQKALVKPRFEGKITEDDDTNGGAP